MSGFWVRGGSNGGARGRDVLVSRVGFAVRATVDVEHRRFVSEIVLVRRIEMKVFNE